MNLVAILFIFALVYKVASLEIAQLSPSSRLRLEQVLVNIDKLAVSSSIKSKWRVGVNKLLSDSTSNANFKKKLRGIRQMLQYHERAPSRIKKKEPLDVSEEVSEKSPKDAPITKRNYERVLKMMEDYLAAQAKESSSKSELAIPAQDESEIDEGYGSYEDDKEVEEKEKEEKIVLPPVKRPKRRRRRFRTRRRARGKRRARERREEEIPGRQIDLFVKEWGEGTKSVNETKKKKHEVEQTPRLQRERYPHVEAFFEAMADKPEEDSTDLWKHLPFYDQDAIDVYDDDKDMEKDKDMDEGREEEEPKKDELEELQKKVDNLITKKENTPISIADELSDSLLLRNNDIDEKLRDSNINACLIDLFIDMLNKFVELALNKQQLSLSDLEKFRRIQIESLATPMNNHQLKKQIHILNNLFRESLSSSFSRLDELKKCPRKGHTKGKLVVPFENLDNDAIDSCLRLKRRANHKELFGEFTGKFVKRIETLCARGDRKLQELSEEERKQFVKFQRLLEGAERRRNIFAQNDPGDADFIEKMNLLKGRIGTLSNQDKNKNPCSEYYNRQFDDLMIQWYGSGDKKQYKATRNNYHRLNGELEWFKETMNGKGKKHKA